jgi:UDP-GlcNAc3NAcA epimerase
VTKPVGYLDFIFLQKNAKKVLTDSGGIQKEAYILKVPCITIRDNTEWIETVEDGWNVLVGSNKEMILNSIINFKPKGKQRMVFGDGQASKKIVNILNQTKG